MQRKENLSFGIVITLIAYLFFSTASSLVWYFEGKFPTIQIIFIQNIVSFFFILPISLRTSLQTKELPSHLMRDLFGLISYYLFFLAIRFLGLVDATALNYTSPFFIPFIWWIWRKEKVPKQVWWSIVIGFIGVAIILNPNNNVFRLGFVFGLFAGITNAIAMCSVRILNLKNEPMSRTLFYFFSIASIISFPFAWAAWIPPTGLEWLLAGAIGAATAAGQLFLTVGFRHGCASYLSPLAYAVVIYNGLISYFIYGKPLHYTTFIGTAFIVLGGMLTYLWKREKEL